MTEAKPDAVITFKLTEGQPGTFSYEGSSDLGLTSEQWTERMGRALAILEGSDPTEDMELSVQTNWDPPAGWAAGDPIR